MVWSLYDSYILDQQDGWHQGQVVIEASDLEHNYRVSLLKISVSKVALSKKLF